MPANEEAMCNFCCGWKGALSFYQGLYRFAQCIWCAGSSSETGIDKDEFSELVRRVIKDREVGSMAHLH